jgi:hypothetical protein
VDAEQAALHAACGKLEFSWITIVSF